MINQELLDVLAEGVARFSAAGKLEVWNKAYAHGYRAVALRKGMPWAEVIESIAEARVAQGIAANKSDYIAERKAYAEQRHGHLFRRLVDGRTIRMEEKPLPDGGWAETFTDISDRESIAKANRQSETLSAVLNAIQAEVVVYDADDCAIMWNAFFARKFEEETGHQPEFGASIGNFLRERLAARGRYSPDEDEREGHEWPGYNHAKQGAFIFEDNGRDYLLREAVSEAGMTVLTIIDITDLKRAERALIQSNVDLEQFAHIASHDLQEPLRTISSFLGLLEQRYGDALDQEGKEYMDFVTGAARRMSELIKDLLVYSRIGHRSLDLQPVSLNQLLTSIAGEFRDALSEADGEIAWGELPTLLAAEPMLGQLLRNLVSNAIKYRGPDPLRILVSAEAQGKGWRISIKDNGIGIAPEHHRRIFEVFRRLHGVNAYSGTGIGLAICERVVRRHGGVIWVDSQKDNGATFTFFWPGDPTATPVLVSDPAGLAKHVTVP